MSDGYSFYCSRCKIDHVGECPPNIFDGDIPSALLDAGKKSIQEVLDELIKALGCGVRVDPDDPSVAIVSYQAVLPGTLRYIPLMFYLDGA